MILKKLIREKKSGHLQIRVYKNVGSDGYEYETIFTSAKWPYWRKTQRTDDPYLVKETFYRWSGHSIFLKYLPPKVCHDFVMKRW